MNYPILYALCVLAAIILFSFFFGKENYCGTTGLTYDQGPLPDPIEEESKSPPFYDLDQPRNPLCSYKNYTMPPPMHYGVFEYNNPELENRYQYWYTGVLSHPQTPYLV